MKLILEAAEHNKAVEEYIKNHHGIDVEVTHLYDINIDFDIGSVIKPKQGTTTELAEGIDEERESAMKRADELGIQYRSNILTSTLVERIEEAEEELVKSVKEDAFETVEPNMEDTEELFPTNSGSVFNTQKEEEQETREEEPKVANIFANFKRNEED